MGQWDNGRSTIGRNLSPQKQQEVPDRGPPYNNSRYSYYKNCTLTVNPHLVIGCIKTCCQPSVLVNILYILLCKSVIPDINAF